MAKAKRSRVRPKKKKPAFTRPKHNLSEAQLNDFWNQLAYRRTASKTALALIMSTGARPAEICRLRWMDWDDNLTLTIPTAKGEAGRSRIMKINSLAHECLTAWRKHVAKRHVLEPTRPMFALPNKTKAITTRALRYACAKIGLRIGIPDLKPYDIRRTFATRVAAELGVGQLQHLLGHTSPASTLRYIQPTPQDRDRAAALTMPRESLAPTG